MKIAVIQMDIAWAQPEANRQRAEAAIRSLPSDVELIVLPEMFSTGFATQPAGVAEAQPSATLEWMLDVAAQRNCAVAGSVALAVKDEPRAADAATSQPADTASAVSYRNRFYFAKPDGSVVHYDKHHLFTYGGEHLRYASGNERIVVEWRGVRFLLMVCYDLRFPIWSRNHEDYDCAIYVANWPTSRIGAWTTLLRARAIENQCYVVGVNRVGTDPVCEYCGGTMVVDAYGRDLAACAMDEEDCATAELDMEALAAFRQKFPVLKDSDV